MHRFIPSPDDPAEGQPDPEHTAAVKRWATEILNPPPDSVITLHETACVDPGCPLVESVITVFDGPGDTRCWRFTRPRVALTKLMVRQTLETPPERPAAGVDSAGSLQP